MESSIFSSPSAHDVTGMSATFSTFVSRGDLLASLRLTLRADDRSEKLSIIGPIASADKFQRLAAAVNEIFGDSK